MQVLLVERAEVRICTSSAFESNMVYNTNTPLRIINQLAPLLSNTRTLFYTSF